MIAPTVLSPLLGKQLGGQQPFRIRGIPGRLHPADSMLAVPNEAGLAHYLRAGRSAMEVILWAVSACRVSGSDVQSALDFACGYGRVTRHLRSSFPGVRLTVCDLDPGGVNFCREEFRARGMVSTERFDGLDLGENHDLIMVGSLFTHLPADLFQVLLTLLGSALSPGGVLVITTHGPSCLDHAAIYGPHVTDMEKSLRSDLDASGHAYVPYPGRESYGVAFTTETGIARFIHGADVGLKLRGRWVRGWDEHQDVYALIRCGSFRPRAT